MALLIEISCGGSATLPELVDVDGNRYRTIQLGTQVWMAENLRATRTSEGMLVVSHPPNEDTTKVADYGRLYDWQTAIHIAPKGWHIPTDLEWSLLEEYLNTVDTIAIKDSLFWTDPSARERQPAGFAARAAGYWNDAGFDNRFGRTAVFWTATAGDSDLVWSRVITVEADSLRRAPQHPHYGFSVRCVRDK